MSKKECLDCHASHVALDQARKDNMALREQVSRQQDQIALVTARNMMLKHKLKTMRESFLNFKKMCEVMLEIDVYD